MVDNELYIVGKQILKENKDSFRVYLHTIQDPFSIDDDLIILAIQSGVPDMLKYLKNHTVELILKAVDNSAIDLLHAQFQNEEICMRTAKSANIEEGYLLGACQYKTPEICLTFIGKDPKAIAYVNEQTEEMCKLAIEMDPRTLQYIRNQTEDLCVRAIEKYPYTVRYVRNVTERIKEVYKNQINSKRGILL